MSRIVCDICVIGAGPGGLTVAAAAARFGRQVVLIEQGRMGGDCLNYGCVPSKALIAAARHAHVFRASTSFGISAVEPDISFPAVIDHVHSAIAAIAPNDSEERFLELGCRVVRAKARFIAPDAVEAAGQTITARRFVIATGSSPSLPPIVGLTGVTYFTTDTIFDNRIRPGHLIILGAGPVGLELGQAFRRLGSAVTVLEAEAPLARADPVSRKIVLDALGREGVEIIAGCRVEAFRQESGHIHASVAVKGVKQEVSGTHLLLAAGRRPNVEDLGLEAAGIAVSASGIGVDPGLRTSNPRVYAIGDVTGAQFTHAASHQAGLVIRNALFRLPVRYEASAMPWVVFTDPEFASVGLSEAEAERRGLAPDVIELPFADNDRALIERRTDGCMRIVLDGKKRVLGAAIVGTNAGELLFPWVHLTRSGERLRTMADAVVPYPTLSETGKRAGLASYAGLASNPWVRRIADVMAVFG
jgi:pyruvate/2-oxoglutarate dehydrogenase complex dihydrolipoamide dehydrogenase (E3) component